MGDAVYVAGRITRMPDSIAPLAAFDLMPLLGCRQMTARLDIMPALAILARITEETFRCRQKVAAAEY